MFSRTINEPVLRSEGLNVEPELTDIQKGNAEPHKMTYWYNYLTPGRGHPGNNRPVVDVSAPFNAMDETHQARRYGTQKLPYGMLSMNEFIGTKEEVPYTESHHTSEIFRLWMLVGNVVCANHFAARAQNSFGPTGNPRVRFAWAIAYSMHMIRSNIAFAIGAGGYFYTYEYLYTHGPWPFRIRDPSPNGWKRAWDEGQDCYLPRAVASIFPALGYAFYMGRWKKSGFWLLVTLTSGLYYEYARRNILSGTRLFYSYLANQDLDRQAGFGSLSPNLHHRVDPDTNRNASAAQFRYYRLTSGEMQETVWENKAHDKQPLSRYGLKLPNPYFNWQKASQNYNEKPWKVKSDLWEMPQVLNAQMLSGSMD